MAGSYAKYSGFGSGGGGGGVTSLNSLVGAVTLVAGSNISITPSGNTLIIAGDPGTVTSVGLADGSTLPIYTISNSPVTSAGTLTFTLNTQTANTILSGPTTGADSQPTFRTLVNADLSSITTLSSLTSAPSLAISGSQVSGGTFGSVNASNLTNFPILNQNTTGSAGSVSGTNVITNSNLVQMPADTIKGNGLGVTANASDLTGAQVNLILPVFTNTLNGLAPLSGGGTTNYLRADGTWDAPPGATSGTVTSVALADSTGTFSITGSPVTTAGTLTLSAFNSQSANTFLAAPNGASGAPSFRLIVPGDVPTLNQNTTGSAGYVSGTNVITNANLVQVAPHSYLGNNTGSTSNVIDVTSTQLTADLNLFSATLQGLVSASGGGTVNFLRADGTWTTPGSGGTVTSVSFTDGSTVPIYTITGSPITSSGTITETLSNQTANTVFAGPSTGSPAQPTFRTLIDTDIPDLSGLYATVALNNLTTTSINADLLPASSTTFNLGGSGQLWNEIFATNTNTNGVTANPGHNIDMSTTPVSGAVNSNPILVFTGTSTTGNTGSISLNSGNSSSGGMTGDILLSPGTTSGTRGKIQFQDGSEGTSGYVWMSIDTSGSGSWMPESGGGVSSVGLADASTTPIFTITGSPVTGSGTLTETLKTQSANTIFAGPISGAAAQPTFRALDSSDIPDLSSLYANVTLSNLTSTAINTDLLPATTVTFDLGGSSQLWNEIFTTNINTNGVTANPGHNITMSTTSVSGAVNSNPIVAFTGTSTTGNTGLISFKSGNSSSGGTTGNILLSPGTTSGTRGKIQFQDGSEGTSGYVWTSTDTLGDGTWMPASGGGSGTVTSVAATVPAFLSISGSPITTSGTLAIGLSGTALPTANGGTNVTSSGAAGNLLVSDGTNWTSSPFFVGASAYAAFASSQINTDSSSISSPTFTTFDNSPAFTFIPTITGTYKVYCPILLQTGGSNAGAVRVFNTSGSATLLAESQGALTIGAGSAAYDNIYTQSIYTLTAGVTYVFDIQGNNQGSGTILNRGTVAPFYMFAEGISLTTSPVSMRYFSSTSTISSSLSTVTYATQDYDTNNGYSSGVYTIAEAGKYQVNASLLITGTIALNNTLIIEIQKNGTVISRRTKYLISSMTDADVQISDIINCALNDTIQIQVSTTVTGPSIVSSDFDNYLSISQIR